jgi:hypothetical protein
MTKDEIKQHAERLRKTEVGMSNYKTVLNDAFVLIRELANKLPDEEKDDGDSSNNPVG